MVVYLIHFSQPISPKSPSRHYIGFANDVAARVRHHRQATSGVRLFEVAKERGIDFEVARVWEDKGKDFERYLKRVHKNAPRLCPICCAEHDIG